jgi:hypothetical protein
MKHLWLIVILALSLITTSAHAAPPYPLQVDATETTMTVSLSGASEVAGQNVVVLAQTEPFTGDIVTFTQGMAGVVSFIDEYALVPFPANHVRTVRPDGTAVWKFTSLSNRQYYVRVYKYTPTSPTQLTLITDTKTLITPAIQTFEAQWPLTVETSGQIAVFSGKVDTSKYATMAGIRIELQYGSAPFPVTTPPSGALPANAYKVDSTLTRDGALTGVNPDGTYYFKLTGLTPKQLYYFRQVVRIQGALVDIQSDKFYAGETYTPTGTSAATDADNKRTYNLLAPWPGLSQLYDPDLCYQKKYIEKTISEDAICDINGFISFAFRLIISFTAVMLVLRLVYEGYQYMMTDVPFLRASAKSNFASALVGLLIALSAYVILNTINPKLVSNKIAIDQVSVGVIPLATIDAGTFSTLTNGKSILAPEEYLLKVKQYANGDKKLECLMVAAINNESRWRPNVIGCDECVGGSTGNNVRSRKIFIQSGVKIDGTALPASASPTDRSMYNPNVFKKDIPGYGLDWRFSKGMGLTQVTVFPEGYNSSDSVYISKVKPGGDLYNNRNNPAAIKQSGSNETVLDFIRKNIDPDENIKAGMSRMKAALQKCGDVNGAFRAYSSGNCSNGIGISERIADYNACMSGNIKIKSN